MWGRHDVAVVLGSGWGDAVAALGEMRQEVPAANLPGFAAPTVEGHGGSLASLVAGDKRVLLFKGRVHLYEGHSPHAVVHGIRVAEAAGCGAVILTNAAGGLNVPGDQSGSGFERPAARPRRGAEHGKRSRGQSGFAAAWRD